MTRPPEVWFFTAATATGGGGVRHTIALMQAMSQLFGERLIIIGRDELKSISLPRQAGRYVAVPLRRRGQKFWWFVRSGAYDLLTPFVDRWLAKRPPPPALAFLDRSWVGRFAPVLAKMGVPVVTMHHNVESDYVGSTTGSLLRPLVLRAIRRNESLALLHSAVNLTMTDEDATRLRLQYGIGACTAMDVLGTFEPFDRAPLPVSFDRCSAKASCHMIMTGSLCDRQTEDGVAWFATKILPRVKSRVPYADLTVAGRQPSQLLQRLARDCGFRVVANPADMDALVCEADLYVAAVRLGSGLKLRLSDALRCGLPVLCHPVSACGYQELYPPPLLQTFTSADEFVAVLGRTQSLLPLAPSLRKSIQSTYSAAFSFSSGVARLFAILRQHLAPELF